MAETLQIPTKVRYDWIDVLKFFGIWAVYISHTGDGAVVLHPVVHTFCVELFFFISGFFACKKSDAGFRDFVFRRFCQLIIPYAFFLVLYFIPMSLDTQMYHPNFPKCLLQGILGMRDRIFAASLWFFPCLFVLSVLYSALYRFASRRFANHANRFLIAVSILLYIAGTLTQPIVLQENAGDLWGVNAACRYMIFFASGHILFPFFREFRFAALKPGANVFSADGGGGFEHHPDGSDGQRTLSLVLSADFGFLLASGDCNAECDRADLRLHPDFSCAG